MKKYLHDRNTKYHIENMCHQFPIYKLIYFVEYIVVIYCIFCFIQKPKSLFSLLSLLFVFICCTIRCHPLSFVVSLDFTRCHSLPLVVIFCHLLSLIFTLCTTRCHFLYHSLSLVLTRCTTRLRKRFIMN